jgi:hypothetical protein
VPIHHRVELQSGIDHSRVDLRERLLPREAALSRRVPELFAEQVHHVGGVGLVEHCEPRGKAEGAAVEPEQPVRDGVERAAPDAAGIAMAADPLDPFEHLAGRPTAERQQQDPLGPDAAVEQRRDASRQRGRLARAGPGDDQEGAVTVSGGCQLLGVEGVEHAFEQHTRRPRRGRAAASTGPDRGVCSLGRREAQRPRASHVHAGGRLERGSRIVRRGQIIRDERARPAAADEPAFLFKTAVGACDGVRGEAEFGGCRPNRRQALAGGERSALDARADRVPHLFVGPVAVFTNGEPQMHGHRAEYGKGRRS